jgi:acetyl esterase/lipase
MVSISAQYRVFDTHGTTPFDAVRDAKSAIRWIRSHADNLQIDPRKLAAGGGSAGGHLAAACALIRDIDSDGVDVSLSPRPDALVLFNPALDTGPESHGATRYGNRYAGISPIHHIRPGAPPTLVMVGSEDIFLPVPTAKRFLEKMAAAGSHCELEIYPGEQHGFFNYRQEDDRNFTLTFQRMATFLADLGFLQRD